MDDLNVDKIKSAIKHLESEIIESLRWNDFYQVREYEKNLRYFQIKLYNIENGVS